LSGVNRLFHFWFPGRHAAGGFEPYGVAAGDFNGDRISDLAVANYNSNTVSVLLGKGDGSFQPAVSYPVGSNPESVAVGDSNGDGIPDLAVANYAPCEDSKGTLPCAKVWS
jgi:hypothetical protein